jgi:NAD(P)-dependent dehydrogenase (short-subunit alcohol dehydrogenase family)
MAALFAQEGADVAIVSRTRETLDAVADEIRATGRRCSVIATDITDVDAPSLIVDQAVSELGGIDILVNNAGGNSFMAPLQTMRYSGWQKTMELNLESVVRLIQAALPPLVESGNGSMINVASVAGLGASPMMAHYGAAKAALISLTRSLAVEVAGQGLRVNALVPGWIETELTDSSEVTRHAERPAVGGAHGAMGHSGGDRPGGAGPGERRILVHDGPDARRRRRPDRQALTYSSSSVRFCG